jgi:hypothetical protein
MQSAPSNLQSAMGMIATEYSTMQEALATIDRCWTNGSLEHRMAWLGVQDLASTGKQPNRRLVRIWST